MNRRRLFGVLAHVDAGKTTVSERMLYASGRIHRLGEVHYGTTTLDHTAEERAHGITITAAATTFGWTPAGAARAELTLIDTPGHIDFAIEVERALRVLDGCVVVLDAAKGVEPQTESVWRQADRHRVPRLVFVNKLDAPGASLQACLEALAGRFKVTPVALQLVAADGALIDLVEQEALRFSPDGTVTRTPVERRAEREALVAAVAEHDPALLERWAQGGEVDAATLHEALRRATLARAVVPVLCGAALRNVGIPPLLDAVARYLPSPADRALPQGLVADATAKVCGFVFKTEHHKHLGPLSWVRVFQGTLRPGESLTLSRTGHAERVSRVLAPHGGHYEPLEHLEAGGIGVVAGLKSARTGDTLCGPGLAVELEGVTSAEPVVELAVMAKNSADQARLTHALQRACFEDPSLQVRVDAETGQSVLRGVGELHLTIWLEKLASREGLVVRSGAPAVALRETVAGEASVTHRHVRQNSGPGQFAVVTLSVGPAPSGAGVRFVDETRAGAIPPAFVPAVELGVRGAAGRGVRDGLPVVDVVVTLKDGQTHPVDSSAAAFEVAGSLAFQAAAAKAGLVRLEPVAAVQVTVPEGFLGAALGELASRRAGVEGVVVEQGEAVVRASMPLAASFGFVTALRSRTEGRGSATLAVAGYQPMVKATGG